MEGLWMDVQPACQLTPLLSVRPVLEIQQGFDLVQTVEVRDFYMCRSVLRGLDCHLNLNPAQRIRIARRTSQFTARRMDTQQVMTRCMPWPVTEWEAPSTFYQQGISGFPQRNGNHDMVALP